MLLWVLFATFAFAAANTAQVVSTHGSDGSVYISSGSVNGDKYFGQWTIGDLTCYIAKGKVDGVPQVVKQCKRGHLGLFHDMTKEEEAIIEAAIQRTEAEKKLLNEKIAEGNAIMQNTMRSMNNQIQRSMTGMQAYMGQMQRMMQQQMQNAFGAFG